MFIDCRVISLDGWKKYFDLGVSTRHALFIDHDMGDAPCTKSVLCCSITSIVKPVGLLFYTNTALFLCCPHIDVTRDLVYMAHCTPWPWPRHFPFWSCEIFAKMFTSNGYTLLFFSFCRMLRRCISKLTSFNWHSSWPNVDTLCRKFVDFRAWHIWKISYWSICFL